MSGPPRSIDTPEEGRTPMLHFAVLSLSRLNGWDADRISRCWIGETGEVADVADISSPSGTSNEILFRRRDDGVINGVGCSKEVEFRDFGS